MINLALDEQETSYIVEASDRNIVRVFSNDPVMQKRFEKLGVVHHKTDGQGRFYKIDLSQFSFGVRRKRQMTDEQRAVMAGRLAAYRAGETTEDETDDLE